MPVSFYIFLLGSIVAFLPAYWDHGETWSEIKGATKMEKRSKILKLTILWIIPISGLLGTVFLGVEAIAGNEQDRQREKEYAGVTNRLGQVEAKYEEATNDLAIATQSARQASNAAKNLNAEALKNLPRHLSNDQKNKLLEAIEPFPKGHFSFSIPQDVGDANGLAQDIYSVFLVGQWQLIPPEGGMLMGLRSGIIVNGDKSNAATVKAIADALTSFGLNGQPETSRWLYRVDIGKLGFSNVVNIIIGYKPQN